MDNSKLPLTTVAEKLASQSSALRENLNSFVEEIVATQADVQSAHELHRLSALEGVLTKAWQGDIDASATEATLPLKKEIATVTEELKFLRQEISVLKTYRPDPAPVTQDGSATLTPAIACVKPPARTGAPTTPPSGAVQNTSPRGELPPLNENLLLPNVTIPALQAAGIPVPPMGAGPQ